MSITSRNQITSESERNASRRMARCSPPSRACIMLRTRNDAKNGKEGILLPQSLFACRGVLKNDSIVTWSAKDAPKCDLIQVASKVCSSLLAVPPRRLKQDPEAASGFEQRWKENVHIHTGTGVPHSLGTPVRHSSSKEEINALQFQFVAVAGHSSSAR